MTGPTHAFSIAQCGCILLNNWSHIPDSSDVQGIVVRSCYSDESVHGLPRDITLVSRRLMADRYAPVPLSETETEELVKDLRQLVHTGYAAYDLQCAMEPFFRRPE